MTDLTFNEQDHTYWWKIKQQLLAITSVLKLANVLDAYVYGTNEVPLTRGSFVHEATTFVDSETLNWETLDDQLVPYVKAYAAFKEECLPKWSMTEHALGDPALGIAGTLDRYGTFVPPGQKRKRLTILDIKTTSTGAMADWHGIQLAGYWHLLTHHLTMTGRMQYEKALKIERWALYLTKDGSYTLKQFSDMKDIAVFNAAVTIAGWRHANGKGDS